MKGLIYCLILLLCLVTAAACGGGDEAAQTAAVTGDVTYAEPLRLPDDATLRIIIQNESLAGAAPAERLLSEQTIANPGQLPFAFTAAYDPAAVNEDATYLLYAFVEASNGNLLYHNSGGTPVLTHGGPAQNVAVAVSPSDGPVALEIAGTTPLPSTTVTGQVTYAEPVEFPAGVTARVQILNASIADAPPDVAMIAEQVITNPDQFPIPFAVPYDETKVAAGAFYLLFARIENADGILLFHNSSGTPVLTLDNPSQDVAVQVAAITPLPQPVEEMSPVVATTITPTVAAAAEAGGGSPTAAAAGLTFELVNFGPSGGELEVISGTQITAEFTAVSVSGFAGCNTYQGEIQPVDDYFIFGTITTTGQVCNEPVGVMTQEQIYLASLQGIEGFEYQWRGDEREAIVGLKLFYPLASGGNGNLTYLTEP